jgi:hypothetical protein
MPRTPQQTEGTMNTMNTWQEHELKTWPKFFKAIRNGDKTFECRRNDRGFRVGDVLVLREFVPETKTYSGNQIRAAVTYMLDGGGSVGVELGFCVMGIRLLAFKFVN